jgi:hypothetical protein
MFFHDERWREFLHNVAFGQRQPAREERPPRPKELLLEIGWMIATVVYMVTVILAVVWISGATASEEHAIATSTTTSLVGHPADPTFMQFL